MKLFNTLTGKTDEIKSLDKHGKANGKGSENGRGKGTKLNLFVCGPTVYDHSHIGHARSAITWDFIIRFLKYMGYKVIWTRNITDIDDKTIRNTIDEFGAKSGIEELKKLNVSFTPNQFFVKIDGNWLTRNQRASYPLPDNRPVIIVTQKPGKKL